MNKLIMVVLCLFAFSGNSIAKITLPKLVGDNMVLQQNAQVKIWGKSTGKQVFVTPSWSKKGYQTKPDEQGNWMLTIETPIAGGPYSITLDDGDKLKIGNVMTGEVWVCSGQSNMEIPIKGYNGQPVKGALDAMMDAANYSFIRMFTVGRNSTDMLQEDCKTGEWLCSSPQSVADCSATAYFFGKTLEKNLNVPIGLIISSWGGSAIETWMDEKTIKETPNLDMETVNRRTRLHEKVALLYNGMINPIKNYTAKGFIWYQGEANRNKPEDYDKLMVSLVNFWRHKWENADMPFYYVQLAHYKYNNLNDIATPLLIEAQYRAANKIIKSGIAATTDVGNEHCIHPGQKEEVGQRLAFLALRNDYGINGLPNEAPQFDSMTIKDNKAFIKLRNTDGASNSLARFDSNSMITYRGFEIAGEDKVFYSASATIENNGLVVTSDKVKEPVAVRYGFRNYIECNVVTNLGQPLVPFRTDSW